MRLLTEWLRCVNLSGMQNTRHRQSSPCLDILKWWLLWASVGRPKIPGLKSHGWNGIFLIGMNGTGHVLNVNPHLRESHVSLDVVLVRRLHFLDHFPLETSESRAIGTVSLHAPEWFLGPRPSDLQQQCCNEQHRKSVLFASNWQRTSRPRGNPVQKL